MTAKTWACALLACLAVSCATRASGPGYRDHPGAEVFIENMASTYQFDRAALRQLFAQVEFKQPIIDLMERPAEKVKEWPDYREIFITERRIAEGVDFWRTHADALARAQREFGVEPAIIVAIIGVETHYGRNKGSYRVIDALATLAFNYPKRSPFFTKELENFLLLAREQHRDPLQLTGSYAGAMGYGQFMPSSYRNYAVDYDGDGRIDIWDNPTDAIGSVANYFVRHGWQPGALVAVRARAEDGYNGGLLNQVSKPELSVAELRANGFLARAPLPPDTRAIVLGLEDPDRDGGTEFWLGLQNFYAITRYNTSYRYAMAVYQLSRLIADRRQHDEG